MATRIIQQCDRCDVTQEQEKVPQGWVVAVLTKQGSWMPNKMWCDKCWQDVSAKIAKAANNAQ